ncbi:MAG: hypothetical protein ACI8XO_003859 [Verrucomicrobiales bacterium]|jgi:hypothetical protein
MKSICKQLAVFSAIALSLVSSPIVALTAGGGVLAVGLSSCSTPQQRQGVRQDTRIESRAEDRYDRRRDR